jgi:endonuclease/exonuclease/phosphatase family metal-dependent hydrolase
VTAPFRVVTYNIHKGVQGVGPLRRLEIHNLAVAVQSLQADVVCLQEVRLLNRLEQRRFALWPDQGQADVLAPPGYHAVYRTNAVTRHGEHGNAVLSRWPVEQCQHEDMSDHRLEQRGLLHAVLRVQQRSLHVVVVHLGLIRGSRVRQVAQLKAFVAREVPPDAPLLVAGDFNDWGPWVDEALASVHLVEAMRVGVPTFPARWPLAQLDHVYTRGLRPSHAWVPHGRDWWRLSDHLPLIVECEWLS